MLPICLFGWPWAKLSGKFLHFVHHILWNESCFEPPDGLLSICDCIALEPSLEEDRSLGRVVHRFDAWRLAPGKCCSSRYDPNM